MPLPSFFSALSEYIEFQAEEVDDGTKACSSYERKG